VLVLLKNNTQTNKQKSKNSKRKVG